MEKNESVSSIVDKMVSISGGNMEMIIQEQILRSSCVGCEFVHYWSIECDMELSAVHFLLLCEV